MNAKVTAMGLLIFLGSTAHAQTTTQPLDLQLPADQVNDEQTAAGGAATPGAYYGDVSGNGADKTVSVHGGFTTGIGYAKGYGTSTMNAAELDVSKQTDSGHTINFHMDVSQTRGIGGYSAYGYGSRYRGF